MDTDGDGVIHSRADDTSGPVEDAADTSVDVPVGTVAGAVGAAGADSAPADADSAIDTLNGDALVVPGADDTPAASTDPAGITEDSSLPEVPTTDYIARPAEVLVPGEVYPALGGVDAVTGVAVATPYTVTVEAVAGELTPVIGGADGTTDAYSDPDSVHEAAPAADRAATDDGDTGGGGGGEDDF